MAMACDLWLLLWWGCCFAGVWRPGALDGGTAGATVVALEVVLAELLMLWLPQRSRRDCRRLINKQTMWVCESIRSIMSQISNVMETSWTNKTSHVRPDEFALGKMHPRPMMANIKFESWQSSAFTSPFGTSHLPGEESRKGSLHTSKNATRGVNLSELKEWTNGRETKKSEMNRQRNKDEWF